MRDPGLRSNRAMELRVGVLVLVSAVLLVWGVFWLSDKEIGGGGLEIYAIAAKNGVPAPSVPTGRVSTCGEWMWARYAGWSYRRTRSSCGWRFATPIPFRMTPAV
ncbi:MAG: hypothetical protein P8Y07_02900 [Gemmatimonadales bacterium]